jgi:hypothetical protein
MGTCQDGGYFGLEPFRIITWLEKILLAVQIRLWFKLVLTILPGVVINVTLTKTDASPNQTNGSVNNSKGWHHLPQHQQQTFQPGHFSNLARAIILLLKSATGCMG